MLSVPYIAKNTSPKWPLLLIAPSHERECCSIILLTFNQLSGPYIQNPSSHA